MLNAMSDVINQNRRRSGVHITVVALSTGVDASRSPTAGLPPTQMPDAVHRSLPGARACAHPAYMTTQLADTLQVVMGGNNFLS